MSKSLVCYYVMKADLGKTGPVGTVQQKPCPHPVPSFLCRFTRLHRTVLLEYFSLLLVLHSKGF